MSAISMVINMMLKTNSPISLLLTERSNITAHLGNSMSTLTLTSPMLLTYVNLSSFRALVKVGGELCESDYCDT